MGIDPGYDRLGWAIGSVSSSKLSLLDYDSIQTKKEDSIFKRYAQILRRLEIIVAKYQPTELAIEKVYFSKNTKTALRVSESKGVVIGYCLHQNLEVLEYTPNQIKQGVTGYGNATKQAIQKMLQHQLKLKNDTLLDDTTDAIAVLLTHHASRKLRTKHV